MAEKITKAQLIDRIQETGNFGTKAEADKALSAVTSAIVSVMAEKKSVTIPMFGTFKTMDIKEKSGKVPGTEKIYTKVAHTAPKMSFSDSVRELVASAE